MPVLIRNLNSASKANYKGNPKLIQIRDAQTSEQQRACKKLSLYITAVERRRLTSGIREKYPPFLKADAVDGHAAGYWEPAPETCIRGGDRGPSPLVQPRGGEYVRQDPLSSKRGKTNPSAPRSSSIRRQYRKGTGSYQG